MRKIYLLSLTLLCFVFIKAQQTTDSLAQKPETTKFTNAEKDFNDWYISAFVGANALQNSDLVSWGDGKFIPGYDFQLSVTKEVTHAFGIALMGQYGKTRQYGEGNQQNYINAWDGKTEYYGISLIGDLNLSNLFRRIDNDSPYRWAWHVYAGAGLIGYEAERKARYNYGDGSRHNQWRTIDDIDLDDRSFYAQVGTGLRYKLSRRFDLEMKAMYVMTGDEEFDASGAPIPGVFTLADIEEGRDDNMLTLSIGAHFKLGKHEESLQWHDPLTSISAIPAAANVPCADDDNDGVCNLYDKCPDTPEGIKVDGAGCPLDTDNDGVFDSIDECPTIPGPPTNNGCPKPIVEVSIGTIASSISDLLQGIEFDYDKDVIREVSYPKLNAAFDILQAHPTYKFYVEGHTDAAGSVTYNQNLSERRAASVVRYLVNKGVSSDQMVPVGKGESDLKHKECDPVSNCPAWKNLENRRVIFKPYGESIDGVEYQQ
ncbi:OmpA family protein [Moheibacter lacus]|uniref:OmpA family protein n=1 Tax=Moheibacter lacus TaxID=2745851 RepID=A0A838ZM33_9FLAO|nr:OmpA family protein [Moheibacter lacus]MBA5629574.1 OmpA family protein [Moheibacter lacus]